jgi:hypothetical protein
MKLLLVLLFVFAVAGAAVLLSRGRTRTTYLNPVDGKQYVGDWRWYQPQTPHGQVGRALQHVVLLGDQGAFEREIGVDSLGALCKRIESTVTETVSDGDPTYDLTIEITLRPDGHPAFQLATRGNPRNEQLQRLYDALTALSPVNTRSVELKFQMVFRVGRAVGPG